MGNINCGDLKYDDSGNRTKYETGGLRDRPKGKGRFDLISPEGLTRWAKRCEIGAEKYGDGRNWEKGMPISQFIDSALRHIAQYEMGDDSEDHMGAAIWNLACVCQLEKRHPEMQDYETRKDKNIFS
jgi:hypothetical protein